MASESQQFELSAMIRDDLFKACGAALEFGDSWTEDDLYDLLAYSAQHAADSYPEGSECE
jgi:hypothetical protein